MLAKLYVVQSIAAATMWKQEVDKDNEKRKEHLGGRREVYLPKGVLDRLGH